MTTTRILVTRPRAAPYALRRISDERQMAPITVLADVLGRHPTNAAAAAELGVCRSTFASWMRRYKDCLLIVPSGPPDYEPGPDDLLEEAPL